MTMAVTIPKFSLRWIMALVAVVAFALALCAQLPVHEAKVTMKTTSGRWLFIDWTSTRSHVEHITRPPNVVEWAIRLGIASIGVVSTMLVLAEHRRNRHSALAILLYCLVLSFTIATAFAVVATLMIPPSNLLHGKISFQDSLVFGIMSSWASVSALIVFPFTYFALRNRRLPRATGILMAGVLAEIVIVTPLDAAFGFIGSFVAYSIGLILAVKFQPASPRQVAAEISGEQ